MGSYDKFLWIFIQIKRSRIGARANKTGAGPIPAARSNIVVAAQTITYYPVLSDWPCLNH